MQRMKSTHYTVIILLINLVGTGVQAMEIDFSQLEGPAAAKATDGDNKKTTLFSSNATEQDVIAELDDIKKNNKQIDINFVNKSGRTALHFAAFRGSGKVVDRLVADFKNIDVDIRDKDGKTALFHAANKGHVSVVETLVGFAGANIFITDNQGRSVGTIVNKILERANLPVETKRHKELSPDHRERYQNIKKLLDIYVDKDGNTLLHKAVIAGDIGSVRKLIKDSFPTNIKNKRGEIPLDIVNKIEKNPKLTPLYRSCCAQIKKLIETGSAEKVTNPANLKPDISQEIMDENIVVNLDDPEHLFTTAAELEKERKLSPPLDDTTPDKIRSPKSTKKVDIVKLEKIIVKEQTPVNMQEWAGRTFNGLIAEYGSTLDIHKALGIPEEGHEASRAKSSKLLTQILIIFLHIEKSGNPWDAASESVLNQLTNHEIGLMQAQLNAWYQAGLPPFGENVSVILGGCKKSEDVAKVVPQVEQPAVAVKKPSLKDLVKSAIRVNQFFANPEDIAQLQQFLTGILDLPGEQQIAFMKSLLREDTNKEGKLNKKCIITFRAAKRKFNKETQEKLDALMLTVRAEIEGLSSAEKAKEEIKEKINDALNTWLYDDESTRKFDEIADLIQQFSQEAFVAFVQQEYGDTQEEIMGGLQNHKIKSEIKTLLDDFVNKDEETKNTLIIKIRELKKQLSDDAFKAIIEATFDTEAVQKEMMEFFSQPDGALDEIKEPKVETESQEIAVEDDEEEEAFEDKMKDLIAQWRDAAEGEDKDSLAQKIHDLENTVSKKELKGFIDENYIAGQLKEIAPLFPAIIPTASEQKTDNIESNVQPSVQVSAAPVIPQEQVSISPSQAAQEDTGAGVFGGRARTVAVPYVQPVKRVDPRLEKIKEALLLIDFWNQADIITDSVQGLESMIVSDLKGEESTITAYILSQLRTNPNITAAKIQQNLCLWERNAPLLYALVTQVVQEKEKEKIVSVERVAAIAAATVGKGGGGVPPQDGDVAIDLAAALDRMPKTVFRTKVEKLMSSRWAKIGGSAAIIAGIAGGIYYWYHKDNYIIRSPDEKLMRDMNALLDTGDYKKFYELMVENQLYQECSEDMKHELSKRIASTMFTLLQERIALKNAWKTQIWGIEDYGRAIDINLSYLVTTRRVLNADVKEVSPRTKSSENDTAVAA